MSSFFLLKKKKLTYCFNNSNKNLIYRCCFALFTNLLVYSKLIAHKKKSLINFVYIYFAQRTTNDDKNKHNF